MKDRIWQSGEKEEEEALGIERSKNEGFKVNMIWGEWALKDKRLEWWKGINDSEKEKIEKEKTSVISIHSITEQMEQLEKSDMRKHGIGIIRKFKEKEETQERLL